MTPEKMPARARPMFDEEADRAIERERERLADVLPAARARPRLELRDAAWGRSDCQRPSMNASTHVCALRSRTTETPGDRVDLVDAIADGDARGDSDRAREQRHRRREELAVPALALLEELDDGIGVALAAILERVRVARELAAMIASSASRSCVASCVHASAMGASSSRIFGAMTRSICCGRRAQRRRRRCSRRRRATERDLAGVVRRNGMRRAVRVEREPAGRRV